MSAPHASLLDAPAPASGRVARATFDADLICTYANPSFADLAGFGLDTLMGTPWSRLFPGLGPSQQAVVNSVATTGEPIGEVDVVVAETGPVCDGAPGARRRWHLVLHRVEGVPGVSGGRVMSVVGTLAAGPAILDRTTFRQRVADSLRDGAAFGVLLVDLGRQSPAGLAARASALRGVVRTTDVVSLDVDASTERSYLALLCPALPAPWTAAVIGDRLRRAAQLTEGLAAAMPQVSVTVARPDDDAQSILRRATASLHTELHSPLDLVQLRTTVRDHAVRSGRAVVLRLAGEADLSTLPGLTRLLEAIIEDRPVGLVIDASQLTFCDVAAMRAVVAAAQRAGRVGTVVGVAGMPATMEPVFNLGWSSPHLQRWPSVQAAVASL
jgi:anti-sigma B factor antagonist